MKMRVCGSAPLVCLSLRPGHHIFSDGQKIAITSCGNDEEMDSVRFFFFFVDRGWPRTFETLRPGEPLVSQLVLIHDTFISEIPPTSSFIIIHHHHHHQHDACQPTF